MPLKIFLIANSKIKSNEKLTHPKIVHISNYLGERIIYIKENEFKADIFKRKLAPDNFQIMNNSIQKCGDLVDKFFSEILGINLFKKYKIIFLSIIKK
jgi:hypothetical protein